MGTSFHVYFTFILCATRRLPLTPINREKYPWKSTSKRLGQGLENTNAIKSMTPPYSIAYWQMARRILFYTTVEVNGEGAFEC